jgi:hypothetical protein
MAIELLGIHHPVPPTTSTKWPLVWSPSSLLPIHASFSYRGHALSIGGFTLSIHRSSPLFIEDIPTLQQLLHTADLIATTLSYKCALPLPSILQPHALFLLYRIFTDIEPLPLSTDCGRRTLRLFAAQVLLPRLQFPFKQPGGDDFSSTSPLRIDVSHAYLYLGEVMAWLNGPIGLPWQREPVVVTCKQQYSYYSCSVRYVLATG